MAISDFGMSVARRAANAARGAREIITDRRGASDVAEKGAHDFVTATDRAVQRLLFAELAAEFPDFALFGEEGTHSVIDPAVPTWVIDPIDGTTNFVRGHEASVVSVALVYEGESVAGVVYDPYTDRAFVAARGEGAYLGDERLHVSDVDYSEAIMAVGTMPYDKSDSDRLFRMWHRIFLETNDLRRIGAAASDIVRVAAGKIEGYCEKRLGTWDFAAASLILTEAGGVFSGWHGERVVMDGVKRSVVAATPRTHERLLRVIEEEYFN